MRARSGSLASAPRRVAWLAPVILAATLVAACGGGTGSDERTLLVFAASSLDETLPGLVELFEAERPGVEVAVVFGGSQLLATQVEEGAPADVLLSADRLQAERLDAGGIAARLLPFATNVLVGVVPEESRVASIEALAEPGLRIAVGASDVPVGALTRSALALLDPEIAMGIRGNVVTEDPNVRVVLSRVELGEVDGAFVYETDAARGRAFGGGVLRVIPLPEALPPNEYVAVALDGASAGGDADAFLNFLAGEKAQGSLRAAGFWPPPAAQ